MYVSFSVGIERAYGNPNPCTDLNKILQAHPHLPMEGFGACLIPARSSLCAEEHIFENCLQNKRKLLLRCTAGCKLTRAARDTSAADNT